MVQRVAFIRTLYLAHSQIYFWSSSISLNTFFQRQHLHHTAQDLGQDYTKIWMEAKLICYYLINCCVLRGGKDAICKKRILQLAAIKNYPLCLIKKINEILSMRVSLFLKWFISLTLILLIRKYRLFVHKYSVTVDVFLLPQLAILCVPHVLNRLRRVRLGFWSVDRDFCSFAYLFFCINLNMGNMPNVEQWKHRGNSLPRCCELQINMFCNNKGIPAS